MGHIAVSFAQMGGDSQVGDLPKSQNGILQFLEKGAGCGFYELVLQGFFQIGGTVEKPFDFRRGDGWFRRSVPQWPWHYGLAQ